MATQNNHIAISYCTQCRWLLRATWMAQELLTTFDDEITSLSLIPASGGLFEVHANEQLLWSRKQEGRFPDITELKQLVRDVIAPDRSLGHSEKKSDKTAQSER
ncbi:MAG: selenoprotein [Methylophaga sp.]|uniref:SelT/SelW/SelH family protein n=1 Tax=unclassified Methylophaga TaxID=2629249 RepID=UPI000C640560|nr:SelT/SelW/SelH family protein [Methylophaga sp. UBA678]MAX53820.1 selenoprotein [Methylophaga sp.]